MDHALGSTSFNEVYQVNSKWFASTIKVDDLDIEVPPQGLSSAANTWDLASDKNESNSICGSTGFSPLESVSTPASELSVNRPKERAAENPIHCASTFLFALTLTAEEKDLIRPIAMPAESPVTESSILLVRDDNNDEISRAGSSSMSNRLEWETHNHQPYTTISYSPSLAAISQKTHGAGIFSNAPAAPTFDTCATSCSASLYPTIARSPKSNHCPPSSSPDISLRPKKRKRSGSVNRRMTEGHEQVRITGDLEVDLGLTTEENWGT